MSFIRDIYHKSKIKNSPELPFVLVLNRPERPQGAKISEKPLEIWLFFFIFLAQEHLKVASDKTFFPK